MNKYIDLLTDTSFAFGGTGVLVVAVLVLLLWLLMPRSDRAKAHLPAILLALHVGLYAAHRLAGSHPLKRALEVTGLFVLLLCLGRTTFLLVFEWLFRHRLKRPVSRIVADIVQVLIYFGVAFVIFREMGAEIGSLLTTSALLTAVIGLSLQETLGNLFAGLAIQAQRPFEVGDWIQIENAQDSSTGRVMEINWRATKLITNDQVEIIIPNGLLAKSPIRNYTKPRSVSRRTIRIQGPYEVAPHRVETALLQAAQGCEGVLDDPAPGTWVAQYTDCGIEYALLYFISDFENRAWIDANVRRRIWYSFQRAGISVPLPTGNMRVPQASDSGAQRLEEEQSRIRQRMMRTVDFLDVLPDSALEHLAHGSKLCLYSKGEDIIRQGEQGTELYLIRSGAASVLFQQNESEPMEVARLGPGGVFGEMSLVTGEVRSATVRTTSTCEVLVIGHDEFSEVLERNPDLVQRISDVLANRRAELEQVHPVSETFDKARESGMLLDKIRSFFSLWPRAEDSEKDGN
jgi:small-conductance mechanosensitive channel/CRP-like cAMP-binding protein